MKKIIYLLVLTLIFSTTLAQNYKICMSNPYKVGDKYRIYGTGTFSELNKVVIKGKTEEIDSLVYEAKIDGVVTVLIVNELKAQKKVKFQITNCSTTNNDEKLMKEYLAKDTEIEVESIEGETVYKIEGKSVSNEISTFLSNFISVSESFAATDDDIHGTNNLVKVGDVWSINTKNYALDLLSDGVKIETENIKGQTTFKKIEKIDNIKCINLEIQCHLTDWTISEMPYGMKLKNSKIKGEMIGNYPLDYYIKPIQSKENYEAEIILVSDPKITDQDISIISKRTSNTEMNYRIVE
ncbi:MAG: hypothetical protein PF574_03975 [Candidatus Delongbacteria bacterium]|nr:hypothetical protein [Candidatus Delongbacteria bacterium]